MCHWVPMWTPMALTCDRTVSPYVQSLNGQWRFHLASKPQEVPDGFFRMISTSRLGRDHGAGKLAVAGRRKVGRQADLYQRPLSLPARPANVPEENPTGCYRTTFALDSSWQGRDVFLLFESVDSAFYLWVNGQKVGYSQGSRLPAEFDITAYVRPGRTPSLYR